MGCEFVPPVEQGNQEEGVVKQIRYFGEPGLFYHLVILLNLAQRYIGVSKVEKEPVIYLLSTDYNPL